MWLKWAKKNQLFSRFSSRGTHQNSFRTITFKKMRNFKKFEKFHFLSIFANFSNIYEVKITFFKKLVEQAPVTYLKFDVF
jgi:hypothetical protein